MITRITLLVFPFLLMTFGVLAQQVTIDPNGRVGIGTESPIRQLEVSGNGSQFGRIVSTNEFPSILEFIRNLNGSGDAMDWRWVNNGYFRLESSPDDFLSNSSTIFQIDETTKNMALGGSFLTAPQTKLEVTSDSWQFRLINSDPGGSDWWIGSSASTWNIGENKFVISPTISSLNAAFVINAAKHIGIGTGNPRTRLHVVGGTDASVNGDGYLVLGDTALTNLVFDNNEILARNNNATSTLYLQKDGGDLLLCADEAGRVGIGVAGIGGLPDDESYLLAVDGKVVCEELRVDMSGSWPDYVFAQDYPLPDIRAVKTYIKEHHHLPGMPSAYDVEMAEGFEVGEMNRMLLEKVEELTLYIIKIQEELDALKELNAGMIKVNQQ